MSSHTVEVEIPKHAITAAALGNATEWFDYGIYSYGVTYIAAALFPGKMQEATLFALATFAISFLVRPVGGLFWGPLGDGFGRKSVLAVTILLMSGATACIGLIPSYADIGLWSPILLIVLRMVQGFSTGGEYGGAATFMAEHAPDNRRGFCGSFLEFGTLGGFSLGALLMLGSSLCLGSQAMHAWGWRIPFFVAAPMGVVGWYLRSRIDDTPVFREIEDKARHRRIDSAIKEVLLGFKKPLLTLGGLVIALNVVNYTLLSYMPTYFSTELGLTTDEALLVPIVGMLLMMPLLPVAGALSDRVGRKPLWWFSLLGLMVVAVPMYELMSSGLIGAMIGFALLGLLYVPQLATISATFPAMFPTHVRFAGFAIAYNSFTSLFGGTAPAANAWLIQATGDHLVPAYFMMGACAIGCVALVFVVETAGASIRGTKTPGVAARARDTTELNSELARR